jgi:hypothetical protein
MRLFHGANYTAWYPFTDPRARLAYGAKIIPLTSQSLDDGGKPPGVLTRRGGAVSVDVFPSSAVSSTPDILS